MIFLVILWGLECLWIQFDLWDLWALLSLYLMLFLVIL